MTGARTKHLVALENPPQGPVPLGELIHLLGISSKALSMSWMQGDKKMKRQFSPEGLRTPA